MASPSLHADPEQDYDHLDPVALVIPVPLLVLSRCDPRELAVWVALRWLGAVFPDQARDAWSYRQLARLCKIDLRTLDGIFAALRTRQLIVAAGAHRVEKDTDSIRDVFAALPGQPPLHDHPLDLWQRLHPEATAADRERLQRLAAEHDLAHQAYGGGFGMYWLGRAIEATLANTSATPTLRYVRGILRSWPERTTDDVSAYGSDAPNYRPRQHTGPVRLPEALHRPLRQPRFPLISRRCGHASSKRFSSSSAPPPSISGSVTACCSSWTRARP